MARALPCVKEEGKVLASHMGSGAACASVCHKAGRVGVRLSRASGWISFWPPQ